MSQPMDPSLKIVLRNGATVDPEMFVTTLDSINALSQMGSECSWAVLELVEFCKGSRRSISEDSSFLLQITGLLSQQGCLDPSIKNIVVSCALEEDGIMRIVSPEFTPETFLLKGENVSYQAKGRYVAQAIAESAGTKVKTIDGTWLTKNAAMLWGQTVVIADAYHLDENNGLMANLSGARILSVPTKLNDAQVEHARANGVTILMPSDMVKPGEFASAIVDGTIRIVTDIPAAPIPGSLQRLQAEDHAAYAAMSKAVQDPRGHAFVYPAGYFTSADGKSSVPLTPNDIDEMRALIAVESARISVVVICGGRCGEKTQKDGTVIPSTASILQDAFLGDRNVVVLAQTETGPDMISAYAQMLLDTGRRAHVAHMDALAGTTLATLETAGIVQGPTLHLIETSTMHATGNEKRADQARAYYRRYVDGVKPEGPSVQEVVAAWAQQEKPAAPQAPAPKAPALTL